MLNLHYHPLSVALAKSGKYSLRTTQTRSCFFQVHVLYKVCRIYIQVSDLIGKIQEAYVETLEELSWMDAPSKEKAREKVTTPSHTHAHTHTHTPCCQRGGADGICCWLTPVVHLSQAMAIKEHIGYPDHILEKNNQKLDEEYAHVSRNCASDPSVCLSAIDH